MQFRLFLWGVILLRLCSRKYFKEGCLSLAFSLIMEQNYICSSLSIYKHGALNDQEFYASGQGMPITCRVNYLLRWAAYQLPRVQEP